MQQHRMGRTGLKVSEVCLGTMTFGSQCDRETSFSIMDRAMDLGVTFFDTADVYPPGGEPRSVGRTEEIIGEWLSERGQRHQIVLATKCRGAMGPGPNDQGLSRKHIMDAVDASLRRLGTDYIDLYQTHREDLEAPIDETMRALDDLIRSGKVRYVGASNYRAWALSKALWTSDRLGISRYDCLQCRYNALYREIESEVLPLCREEGLGVIVYNPLAAGLLTGKHRPAQGPSSDTRFGMGSWGQMYQGRYWHDTHFNAVEKLRAFFEPRGQKLASVAVSWVLAQPGITSAIVGASRPDQLTDSLAGVELKLDREAAAALDAVWYDLPRQRPDSPQARL